LREIVLPRGAGLGLLEGWETIQVDGDEPQMGTGAEDWFNGGFYFQGAPFHTPTHGCSYRSFFWGRVSAWRFLAPEEQIPFERSFSFLLDHGLRNEMAGVIDATAFWYEVEPHSTQPPLAPWSERRWGVPLSSPAQWLALCGLGSVCMFLVYTLVW
jgi:hypothetical protein